MPNMSGGRAVIVEAGIGGLAAAAALADGFAETGRVRAAAIAAISIS